MLDLGSDRATFVNVKITGYQDTLFPNSGRSYFAQVRGVGHVDFIFGAGQAVFDDCDIVSRDRGSKTNNGYVTAASTDVGQPYGFLFLRQPPEEGTALRCRPTRSRSADPGIRSPTREPSASVAFIRLLDGRPHRRKGLGPHVVGRLDRHAHVVRARGGALRRAWNEGPGRRSERNAARVERRRRRAVHAGAVLSGWTPVFGSTATP